MIWSSYNFWCHLHYDKQGCPYDRWANKKHHVRSPELFHELIQGDANGTQMVQPFYYPMHKPCMNAGGYYTEFIDLHLHRAGLRNDTIVIASEEYEVRPMDSIRYIAKRLKIDIGSFHLSPNISQLRINAQDNKGADHVISVKQYKPGLYGISNYRPMLNETKELLDKCWRMDCIALAEKYGYFYAACLDDYLDKHKLTSLPRAYQQYQWKEEEKTSMVKEHAMTRLLYVYRDDK
jgi:hypothetical protein